MYMTHSIELALLYLCVQFAEQFGVRQSIQGGGESPAEVPLFLSGGEDTQRAGGRCLWLGHGQLLG